MSNFSIKDDRDILRQSPRHGAALLDEYVASFTQYSDEYRNLVLPNRVTKPVDPSADGLDGFPNEPHCLKSKLVRKIDRKEETLSTDLRRVHFQRNRFAGR